MIIRGQKPQDILQMQDVFFCRLKNIGPASQKRCADDGFSFPDIFRGRKPYDLVDRFLGQLLFKQAAETLLAFDI